MIRYIVPLLLVGVIGCSDNSITSNYAPRGPEYVGPALASPPVFPQAPTFPIDSTWNEDNRGYLVGEDDTPWVNWTGPWHDWNFRYITAKDELPIRAGWRAERIEVRPGDCFKGDCFRSPVFERVERNEHPFKNESVAVVEGDTVWYGWSFYFPSNTPELSWAFIAQFHEHSPHFNPSWALLKRRGRPLCLLHDMNLTREWDCNPWTELPHQHVSGTYPIIPHDEFYDRWYDMVVQAHWSSKEDGFFRMWVNGVMVMDRNGANYYHDAELMIFKYGIYRIAHNQENVGYFDEIRMGRSREEVDILMMTP